MLGQIVQRNKKAQETRN